MPQESLSNEFFKELDMRSGLNNELFVHAKPHL
ncbi:MAG: hypothetical protein ACI9VN_003016 [Patescibacteria group bacterium]